MPIVSDRLREIVVELASNSICLWECQSCTLALNGD